MKFLQPRLNFGTKLVRYLSSYLGLSTYVGMGGMLNGGTWCCLVNMLCQYFGTIDHNGCWPIDIIHYKITAHRTMGGNDGQLKLFSSIVSTRQIGVNQQRPQVGTLLGRIFCMSSLSVQCGMCTCT
jgi:hypothetical protein